MGPPAAGRRRNQCRPYQCRLPARCSCPPESWATADPAEALAGVRTVFLGVPSQTMRANLENWRADIDGGADPGQPGQGHRIGKLSSDESGDRLGHRCGPGSGRGRLRTQSRRGDRRRAAAATVVACTDSGRAVALQRALDTGYFRPYTNTDVLGTEIGGACKNVIALACGMASGVGLGENTAAAIITRGLAEIIRLGLALGAEVTTLAGLAGVGDLVATCTSAQSRNRTFGDRLGSGQTLEAAIRATEGHVAEGVTSCSAILALASRYGVEMPLTEAVFQVSTKACPSPMRSPCCWVAAPKRSERGHRRVRRCVVEGILMPR